jgi:hypothetical protein
MRRFRFVRFPPSSFLRIFSTPPDTRSIDSGYETIKAMESVETDSRDRPIEGIVILRAGELELVKKPKAATDGTSLPFSCRSHPNKTHTDS